MKLFTRNAKAMAREMFANRPLNIPAMEWHDMIKESLFDEMLDDMESSICKPATHVKTVTPTLAEFKVAYLQAEEQMEFYSDLKAFLIEHQDAPGFIRPEIVTESREDGIKRVKSSIRKVKRLAKKEGKPVDSYSEFKSLEKELAVLGDEKNIAIYKPELKLNWAFEYRRVTKAWMDGSSRGKGKEGHRESLGSSLCFETPVYKRGFSEKTGEVTETIVAYDIILKVDNGSLSAPSGIMSMVFSFLKTLVRKGVFKNNQLITRDKYGYTYLVQELVSDVGLDIAQNSGWVTMNSYKLMNQTFYQTIRSKQQSKKVYLERQSWLGSNKGYLLALLKDEIGFAIDYIASGARCECPSFNPLEDPMVCAVANEMKRNGYSVKEISIWIRDYQKKLESEWYADHPEVNFTNNWAKENPDYADDVITFKKGYHKMVIKYFLAANNSETLRVHKFDEKFPQEELDKYYVDANVLKELASEVKDYLRTRFGSHANAFENLNRMIDEIRAQKDEHGFIQEFIRGELNKNIGHKITHNLDGFRDESADKLALVDSHGELIVPEEDSTLPMAYEMFNVSNDEIADIGLDEEIETSLQ